MFYLVSRFSNRKLDREVPLAQSMSSRKRKFQNEIIRIPNKKRKLHHYSDSNSEYDSSSSDPSSSESSSSDSSFDRSSDSSSSESSSTNTETNLNHQIAKDIQLLFKAHGIIAKPQMVKDFVTNVMDLNSSNNSIDTQPETKCFSCKKYCKLQRCGDCDLKSCVECGKLEEPKILTLDMKCPCAKCSSNERSGRVACFSCSKPLVRYRANGCIVCHNTFCKKCNGSACSDCLEYQCGTCTDMEQCEQCGDLVCNINGCVADHEESCC
eukprot:186361_1